MAARGPMLGLLLLALLGGCAHHAGALAGGAAEAVPRPLIQESLRTLTDDETRELLSELLEMPDVRAATRVLVSDVTDGTLDALDEDERADRLGIIADAFVARLSSSLAEATEEDLGPALAASISGALRASLDRALDEATRERMALLVAQIARQAVVAVAVAIRDDLAPALRASLRDELGPAVAEALESERTQRALATLVRSVMREGVLGIEDGLAAAQREGRARGEPATFLSRGRLLSEDTVDALQLVTFVLALAVVAMIAWMVRSVLRQRGAPEREERAEAAIRALAGALEKAEKRPWARELAEHLQAHLREEDASYVRELLRRRAEPRLETDRDRSPSAWPFASRT